MSISEKSSIFERLSKKKISIININNNLNNLLTSSVYSNETLSIGGSSQISTYTANMNKDSIKPSSRDTVLANVSTTSSARLTTIDLSPTSSSIANVSPTSATKLATLELSPTSTANMNKDSIKLSSTSSNNISSMKRRSNYKTENELHKNTSVEEDKTDLDQIVLENLDLSSDTEELDKNINDILEKLKNVL